MNTSFISGVTVMKDTFFGIIHYNYMSVEFTAHFNLMQYTLGVKIQNMKMDFDTGAHGMASGIVNEH